MRQGAPKTTADTMAAPALLSIESLSVCIGSRIILAPASATFQAGECVMIIGPNGAGKSTWLKGILGLVPASGMVRMADNPVAAMLPKERARQIAYLPQGHEAHWPVSVRAIVALGRFPHGASDPDRLNDTDAGIVDKAMAATDISHLADRIVATLSGGERARVALARVLAVRSPVILCDEPTASLDPGQQLSVMALLRNAARAGGLVISVTHDLAFAARFADRIILLHEGNVLADGPPTKVLTPELLRQVYGIEAFVTQYQDETVLLPWTGAKRVETAP